MRKAYVIAIGLCCCYRKDTIITEVTNVHVCGFTNSIKLTCKFHKVTIKKGIIMFIPFDKDMLLRLSLLTIWSVVQCKEIVNKVRCPPDCDTAKQETQKFYCIATQMYEELKTVSFFFLI